MTAGEAIARMSDLYSKRLADEGDDKAVKV